MQPCNRIYYSKNLLKAKHVSSGTPLVIRSSKLYLQPLVYTGCPIRYRTRHFFKNFTTNEDIATKFEADLPHCVRNVKENNILLFKFRCNIFIGVIIIKEMPGSVASGTPCICYVCICMHECIKCVTNILTK